MKENLSSLKYLKVSSCFGRGSFCCYAEGNWNHNKNENGNNILLRKQLKMSLLIYFGQEGTSTSSISIFQYQQ